MQAINAARAQNAHDRSGEPYAVVPCSDGSLPPWPLGFDRGALRGPIAVIDALLNEYGLLPNGAPLTALQRRDSLALHIGTARV